MAERYGGIQVQGARELRRSLKAAGRKVNELKPAHKEVGQIVAGAGKASAPTSSGKLARSVRAGATNTAAVVRAGGARVPYANVIHWGWPARNIEPHPWLSNAAQQTEPAWVSVYEQAVEDVLKSIRGA